MRIELQADRQLRPTEWRLLLSFVNGRMWCRDDGSVVLDVESKGEVDYVRRWADATAKFYGISVRKCTEIKTKQFSSANLCMWLAVMASFSFLLSVKSVNCGLLYDDPSAVLDNPDANGRRHISGILWHDFWGTPLSSIGSHKSFRPLTTLSFRLNHQLHGNWEPGFHIGNILLHVIACCLVFLFAALQLPTAAAALSSGLLFCAHPIHTECVYNIVGRAEELCLIFILLAVFCYESMELRLWEFWKYKFCTTETQGNVPELSRPASRNHSVMCHLGCLFFMLLAMASKETGMLVPGILLCLQLAKGQPKNINSLITNLAPSFALFVVAFYTRWCLQGYTFKMATPPLYYDTQMHVWSDAATHARTRSWLHCVYFYLLLVPFNLSPDYSHPAIPLVESNSDIRVLQTILVYMFVIVTTLYLWYRQERAWLVSIGFGMMTFVPASGFVVAVGTVVGERLLYAPSVGYCMMLGLLLFDVDRHFRRIGLMSRVYLFGTILLLYSVRSYTRTPDWYTEEALWTACLHAQPNSNRPWRELGIIRTWNGSFDAQTESMFERSQKLFTNSKTTMLLMATKSQLGKYDECIDLGQKCFELKPPEKIVVDCLTVFSTCTLLKGNLSFTMSALDQCLQFKKDSIQCITNYGHYQRLKGRWKEAAEWFDKAVKLKPGNMLARKELAKAHSHLGNWKGCLNVVDAVLKLKQNEEEFNKVERMVEWEFWEQAHNNCSAEIRLQFPSEIRKGVLNHD